MWQPQGFYSKYLLKQPTLLFGENSVRGLYNFPASRVAVVHGKGLSEDQHSVIKKSIKAFELKFISKSWDKEPVLQEIFGTIEELERFKPDLIVAVGGGSVIDGTKIARLLYEFPFFDFKNQKISSLEWKTKFIAFPTTIGSGAEISSSAVLLNRDKKSKEFIVSNELIPDVIILDPICITTSPKKIIYSSAIDAISHIIEGYTSVVDNIIADVYAEKGLNIFYNSFLHGERPFTSTDLNRLQLAGYFGGIVQNHCIVGVAHAIAHQLAGYGFIHSEAIALILKSVILVNSKDRKIECKYEKLAENSGIDSLSGIIELIDNINCQIELKEQKDKLKLIMPKLINSSEFLLNVKKDAGGKGNPIPITDEYIIEILNGVL
jgi:alcohol dehydrogenase class IV